MSHNGHLSFVCPLKILQIIVNVKLLVNLQWQPLFFIFQLFSTARPLFFVILPVYNMRK